MKATTARTAVATADTAARGAAPADGAAAAHAPPGYAYAPGETRQRVYDVSFVPGARGWYTRVYGRPDAFVLGPGRYVFAGTYGNFYDARRSDSAVVTLAP